MMPVVDRLAGEIRRRQRRGGRDQRAPPSSARPACGRGAAGRAASAPCGRARPRRGAAARGRGAGSSALHALGRLRAVAGPAVAARPRALGLLRLAAAHSRATSSRSSRSRCRKAVSQPVLGDLAVERAALEQLLVGAAVDDPARLHDDDLVGERDRREPVGDDEGRPALHRLAQAALDLAPRCGRRPRRSRRRGSGSAARRAAPARSRPAGAGRRRGSARARRRPSRSRPGSRSMNVVRLRAPRRGSISSRSRPGCA